MGKQEEAMTYKRMYYGCQVVEWSDAEMVARRYDLVDVRAELRFAITAKMVEEKSIPDNMIAKFDEAWKYYGSVIVKR